MTRIVELLNIMKSVVDRSYQIEFAGVDKASGKGFDRDLLGDINSPIVVYRAALFTEVKDAYATLSKSEQRFIDFCVKKKDSTITSLIDFINKKVGGRDGLGACLQTATHSLKQLHNAIIKELELENECKEIDDNIDTYRTMPKVEISRMRLEPEKGEGEEELNEGTAEANRTMHKFEISQMPLEPEEGEGEEDLNEGSAEANRTMPKLEINRMPLEPEKGEREEDLNEGLAKLSCTIS